MGGGGDPHSAPLPPGEQVEAASGSGTESDGSGSDGEGGEGDRPFVKAGATKEEKAAHKAAVKAANRARRLTKKPKHQKGKGGK